MSMVTSELSNTTPAGVSYTIRNTRKLVDDSGSHQSPCKLVEVFIHVALEFITIPCLSCSQFNNPKHYYDHFQAKITASISRAHSLASSAAIIAGDVLDYAVQLANQHRRKHVVAVMFQTTEVVDYDESIGAKRKREHECVVCMEEIGTVGVWESGYRCVVNMFFIARACFSGWIKAMPVRSAAPNYPSGSIDI